MATMSIAETGDWAAADFGEDGVPVAGVDPDPEPEEDGAGAPVGEAPGNFLLHLLRAEESPPQAAGRAAARV